MLQEKLSKDIGKFKNRLELDDLDHSPEDRSLSPSSPK